VIIDYDSLMKFSAVVMKSGLAPKGMGSVEAVAVAIQYGLEIGLTPIQALQSVAVINGRPSIYGDAMLGVVRASHLLQSIDERIEGDGDQRVAVCVVQRVGSAPKTTTFSVADAKRAGLWGKPGPWQQYSDRMLRMRARSWALRDEFGDVLRGLIAAEEAQDIPATEPIVSPKPDAPAATIPPPSVPVAALPAEAAHATDPSASVIDAINTECRNRGIDDTMLGRALARYRAVCIDDLTPPQLDDLLIRVRTYQPPAPPKQLPKYESYPRVADDTDRGDAYEGDD
jgi:hypothetical protein